MFFFSLSFLADAKGINHENSTMDNNILFFIYIY